MTTFEPGIGDWLTLAGRLLLSAMFYVSAWDKLMLDPHEVEMIRGLGLPAPELLERLTGLFEAVTATMLVVGFGARAAAVLLAGFTVFTTLTFLRFWSLDGPPDARQGLRSIFFANWAVTGGLVLVAAVGPGRLALAGQW